VLVATRTSKATPTATTAITARVVIGTTVIAVEQMLKKASAPSVSVWTRITCHQRPRRQPQPRQNDPIAATRNTRVTATVTTRTTERLALGMAAIAVGHPLARNTAKSAYVWTPTRRPQRRQQKPIAVTRHTRKTVTATMTIT